MRNIIVVQCMSTGKNFIQDIIDRGCNPIVLELLPFDDSEEAHEYHEHILTDYKSIENDFELIYEKESYEDTLEMIRGYDPLLIVPGTEEGIRLATQLSSDLCLLGNPVENLDAMTLKDKMHERIAEKGLRSIRGRRVSSVEEAVEFYDSDNLSEVVVKPVLSAGSIGVHICSNRDAMIDAVRKLLNSKGAYGNDLDSVLVQERIFGDEYIVNTVSCNGVHRITTIWKYTKIRTPEGGMIYDYSITVNELGIGEAELVEYAYDVVDSLGIQYGPVHGEYMIDENGPVLMEVNCRPMGANFDAAYLDMISGQHETDSILDSYLNPAKFDLMRKRSYKLFKYGIIKSFIVPDDVVARSTPLDNFGMHLESHYNLVLKSIDDYHLFRKTQDMETSPGVIYLVNKDKGRLLDDLHFIQNLEKRAFGLVLSEEKHEKEYESGIEEQETLTTLLEAIESMGTTLLVTDEIISDVNALQVGIEDLDKITGEFDSVVINLNKSIMHRNDNDIVRLMLNIYDKVRVGGAVFIPKSTCDYLPNGRLGAEALLKVLNFRIEMPVHQLTRMVIASKARN